MNFLERSNSRIRKERPRGMGRTKDDMTGLEHQPPQDTFDSIDDAVAEQRKPTGKRPTTSAGLEKRKRSLSKPRTAAKEVKEPTCSEDLHLVGQTLEYQDGLDTFRFPTPSPRLPPPPRSATYQHYPSPLHQSVNQFAYFENPKIGVAIGSPSHAPPSWGRSYTADQIHTMKRKPPDCTPPTPPINEYDASPKPDQRKKKSSWKTLGTIFRWTSKPSQTQGKPRKEEINLASCSPPIRSPETLGDPSPGVPSPKPVTRKLQRQLHAVTPSLPQGSKSHFDLGQTSFMPTSNFRTNRGLRTRASMTPSPRLKTHRCQDSEEIFAPKQEERHDSPMSPLNEGLETLHLPQTPRLDVDIEKPEFERYSVMFEKLLSNEHRMSLLERRQSRLQRERSCRKTVEGVNRNEDLPTLPQLPAILQRTVSSPHLSRCSSIKVDGEEVEVGSATTEVPRTAIHRSDHIMRYSTPPPQTVSTASRDRKTTLESSPESPGSACFSEVSMPTPTTITTCTDRGSPQREWEKSPLWDILPSKPVTVTSPPTSTTTVSGSGSGSRSRTSEPYPRVRSPEELERQIVQVSVARQVSVSRARDRVQQAVATSTFKQPMRPRVVELSKNRKSTVGVLESTDDIPNMPNTTASKMDLIDEAGEIDGKDEEGSAEKRKESQVPSICVLNTEGELAERVQNA